MTTGVAPPRRYDLLVLDYGGVCTMSHRELVDSPSGTLDIERSECVPVVLAAQAIGMQVAVLSNEIDRAWIEHSAVLSQVDHVIPCGDNGVFKPDRRAYQRALLVSRCTAERALFVDDDLDNVRGAQGAGLASMLFDATDPVAAWSLIHAMISAP
jgi:putative hydrolase of the HAD superfamily